MFWAYTILIFTYLVLAGAKPLAHTGNQTLHRSSRYVKSDLTSWERGHVKRTTRSYNAQMERGFMWTTGGFDDEWSIVDGDEDECIVMFGGSDSAAEWYSNFDGQSILPIALDSGGERIAYGVQAWVEVWNSIRGTIQKQIEEHCGKRLVVTFAGHSRGGAIAQVAAAAYLTGQHSRYVRTVTWGAPRAISNSYANEMTSGKDEYYNIRVMNNKDPVTGAVSSKYYKHIGNLVCLDCTKSGQDDSFNPVLNIFGGLTNHPFKNYLRKIEAW